MKDDRQKSLLQTLEEYRTSGVLPMHMPGHKRNTALAPYLATFDAGCDITEIDGFDDLHDADGILDGAMKRASLTWRSERTWFLVGGSTCGILAGIRAALFSGTRGDVIAFRNCHKAVYHALELTDAKVTFLLPEVIPDCSFAGAASPQLLSEALDRHPATRLVILTSPTYEGVVSDVREICRIAHGSGAMVLVDEAHGAHFGFAPAFPESAVACGADLVIQSVHKTLPSLTQTALLHRNGSRISDGEIERQLEIFETSSPSYLLMASIDECVRLMEEKGGELCRVWADSLARFDRRIAGLRHLHVFCHGRKRGSLPEGVFAVDPSKIVILTGNAGMTGMELARILRESFRIELEMAAGDYAVAMTGAGDTDEGLTRLSDALLAIDRTPERNSAGEKITIPQPRSLPEQRMTVSLALRHVAENVPAAKAAGRVSGAYLWAYPPGIPLILPGETVSAELIGCLSAAEAAGVRIKSLPERTAGSLLCLAEA